jgi:phage head maturation protease
MSGHYTLSPPRLGWSLDDDWRLPESSGRVYRLEDDSSVAVAELEVIRTADIAELSARDAGGDDLVVESLAVPWNKWTEIKDPREGHFFERFAPGSITAMPGKLRLLWSHGDDRAIGRQPIGEVTQLRNEPTGLWAKASLLSGVPPLIVSGLRRGLFGASVRFKPLQVDVVRRPGRSAGNPDGIEERTVRSAGVREISLVNWPQYSTTSASLVD